MAKRPLRRTRGLEGAGVLLSRKMQEWSLLLGWEGLSGGGGLLSLCHASLAHAKLVFQPQEGPWG